MYKTIKDMLRWQDCARTNKFYYFNQQSNLNDQ